MAMCWESFQEQAQIRTPLLSVGGPSNAAGFGGFLHLPLFGHNRDVQQAERQTHHHEYECHGLNVIPWFRLAKVTPVPAR